MAYWKDKWNKTRRREQRRAARAAARPTKAEMALRNLEIVRLHWTDGRTLREIAVAKGLKHQRIYQILKASARGVRTRDQAARMRAPLVEWSCQGCGTRIGITEAKASVRKYCSRACSDKAKRLQLEVLTEAIGLRNRGLTLNGLREAMGVRWSEGLRKLLLDNSVKRFSRRKPELMPK
jgi:hypothetical protein